MHPHRSLLALGSLLTAAALCVGGWALAAPAPKPAPARPSPRVIDMPKEMDVPTVPVPPAPPLSPEQSLATIRVAPGYRVELVAAEPLVQDPVSIQFDADGRLWVCEMRSYMLDVDAVDEEKPIGRISVLEDTDQDGRMDKQTIFADGLVLPRVATPYRDGVFVAAPPNLWFMRDTNGDGKADEKQLLATDYTNRSNPEHQPNAMMPALDNWVYNADWPGTFRYIGDGLPAGVSVPRTTPAGIDPRWVRINLPTKSQYGLTQDDVGRQFANTNSDQLRGDQLPVRLMARNPNGRNLGGLNMKIADSQTTWPIRPTPGINRGYQPKMLDDEGYLKTVTAACAPLVYRGDRMPELAGNVFICEPSAHLVKRNVLSEKDGVVSATNTPYPGPDGRKADFLASTDERFRPVFLANGPDGAMYVADLYRGVLQHKQYVTPYLRKQIYERELETPLHLGRIYRVVPDNAPTPAAARPRMLKAPAGEMVDLLSHTNGWWRDNAQQQIIARNDPSVGPALKKLAATGESRLGRLHALYTLEGLRLLNPQTLRTALNDADPDVRTAAVRLCEPMLQSPRQIAELLPAVRKLDADPSPSVRMAVLMVAPSALVPVDRQSADAIANLYLANAERPWALDALLSGVGGRESAILAVLLQQSELPKGKEASDLIAALARYVMTEGSPSKVQQLLATLGTVGDWRRSAAMGGLTSVDKKSARMVRLPAEPPELATWRDGDAATRKQAAALAKLLSWPGKAADPDVPAVRPLSAPEQASFERGKLIYATVCAACHEIDGNGAPGKAPSMRGSPLLIGHEGRPIRIVLHGLRGQVEINGERADMEMPTLSVLSDEQIADVLTYARREWDHRADPVAPKSIAAAREETKERGQPWSREEVTSLKFAGEKK